MGPPQDPPTSQATADSPHFVSSSWTQAASSSFCQKQDKPNLPYLATESGALVFLSLAMKHLKTLEYLELTHSYTSCHPSHLDANSTLGRGSQAAPSWCFLLSTSRNVDSFVSSSQRDPNELLPRRKRRLLRDFARMSEGR